jgi:hypothetical protein
MAPAIRLAIPVEHGENVPQLRQGFNKPSRLAKADAVGGQVGAGESIFIMETLINHRFQPETDRGREVKQKTDNLRGNPGSGQSRQTLSSR